MNILAINFNHDGAGAILSDGAIAGYVTTERFSRRKKHPGIREQDLLELLSQSGLELDEIDMVYVLNYGIMDSPEIVQMHGGDLRDTWVPFELEKYQGWTTTVTTIRLLGRELDCVVNPRHHLLHSSLAYYFSPFDSAVTFSYDPIGVGAFLGRGNRLEHVPFELFNVSQLYNDVSARIGFGGIFGAGKTMGLAPYGRHEDRAVIDELRRAVERDPRNEERRAVVELLVHLSSRDPVFVEEGEKRWNATLAFNLQTYLELTLSRVMDRLHALCEAQGIEPNLCLAGGTALNSVANQKCFAASRFQSLYLHPSCGDDGTSLGAALFQHHHVLNQPRRARTNREAMYSVRSYEHLVGPTLERHRDRLAVRESADYIREAARLIADGKILGWYQGASEQGPRALGNRSIVCDPRRPEMKRVLNSRVKFREMFRPFAPSVLNEHAKAWFGLDDSPFMLRVSDVLKPDIPAVTHVDNTARPQTVAREDNPSYYDLIRAFFEQTGVPLVLNTSFNLNNEPLVETPEDAIQCFLRSDFDGLVFPGLLVTRR